VGDLIYGGHVPFCVSLISKRVGLGNLAKFSYAPLPPRGFRKLSNGILVQRHRVPPPDGHQQHPAPSKLPPLELSRRQPALLVAATLCSDPQAMTTQFLVSYTSLTAFCVIHLTHAIKGPSDARILACHSLMLAPYYLSSSIIDCPFHVNNFKTNCTHHQLLYMSARQGPGSEERRRRAGRGSRAAVIKALGPASSW